MKNVDIPRVSMPPGRQFQALWTLLHLGALGLAVYVAKSDLKRLTKVVPRAVGIFLLLGASSLHLVSAVYHGQKAL